MVRWFNGAEGNPQKVVQCRWWFTSQL